MGLDRLALDLGKPVYIWGASVGPFEAEPHFVPVIRKHLARMTMIAVRESISYAYLTQTLGLSNVTQMADPAFTLSRAAVDVDAFWPMAGPNGTVGLNISPLIERYKSNNQDLRAETIQFVRDTVAKGFGVLLVPHVIPLDGAEKNNDAIYMAKMLEQMKDLGDAVRLMPAALNASQIKQVISQLRFFIGARTHATIAALSSGVPTLSISYSVKARGINKDLLGDMPVVLPTPELTAVSLAAGLDYLTANEARIRAVLAKRVPQLQGLVASMAGQFRDGLHGNA
jgi:colanic acid/amylovoran biosynthesis protein